MDGVLVKRCVRGREGREVKVDEEESFEARSFSRRRSHVEQGAIVASVVHTRGLVARDGTENARLG
jgi:hypothetical protein